VHPKPTKGVIGMCKKTNDENMKSFKEFLATNKEKIRHITEANSIKNEDGLIVIAKDDPWRKETEWDSMYEKLFPNR
jgi:selenophosphate synthetase-related protein